MSPDELCSGVNNDVNTVLDRSEEIWCSESAVNNERNAVLVSDLCNFLNVDDVRVGVAECFDVDSLCIGLDSSLE